MKLLPKKQDIDKARAQERKIEIDAGLALAKSVDTLREQLLSEKKSLTEWRNSNVAKIQQEIDSYLEVRENLRIETEKAEKFRKELLKPLDNEWEEINSVKIKIGKQSNDNFILSQQLKIEENDLEMKKKEIEQLILQAREYEKDTKKEKIETVNLKKLAQNEYELARMEHISQIDSHEKKLAEAFQSKKEYEVALETIQIRENEVKEKESELIIREAHLESQQMALRKAREILNK